MERTVILLSPRVYILYMCFTEDNLELIPIDT